MRLRIKILAATMGPALVVGLSAIAVIGTFLAWRLETELHKRGISIARNLAEGSANFILTENLLELQGLVEAHLKTEEDLVYIFIANGGGRIMAHSFGDSFPPDLLGVNDLEPGEDHSIRVLDTEQGRVYDMGAAVGGGTVGTVHVGVSGQAIKAGVTRVARSGILMVSIVLLLVVAALLVVDRALVTPIEGLTEATRAIAGGDLGRRVTVRSGDELGVLAGAFNEMADNVQRSREELSVIIEGLPIAIFLVDGERRVRRVNPMAKNFADIGVEEVHGRRTGRILRCVNAAEDPRGCGYGKACSECTIRLAINDTMRNKRPNLRGESQLNRVSEEPIHLLVSTMPVVIEAEPLVLVSIEDVSQLKLVESRLRAAYSDLERQNLELRELDKIKDGLIRDVSHELKTPVAKQAMQIEILRKLLKGCCEDPEVGRVLSTLEQTIGRQDRVIRNILTLSRLEPGQRHYRREPTRLDEVLSDVMEDYSAMLHVQGVALVTDLKPVIIQSDREMLWHVFSNLFNNAVKYRRPGDGATVEVRVGLRGDRAVVTIADNGVGLETEDLERVFDRFYQASSTAEGIGVGLTIVRMILDGLGGTVSLESRGRGTGTTAMVTLPLA